MCNHRRLCQAQKLGYVIVFFVIFTFRRHFGEVFPAGAFLTFYKEKIYLTGKPRSGENTTIQVFNRADLKLAKTIEPPAPVN